MTTPDVDLLVIGAGPTGLTAACEAHRLGLSVRIVDRKVGRSTVSKALVVHARTLEALRIMGVADRVLAAGTVFEALNVRFGAARPVRVDLEHLAWGDTRYPFWLSIAQYDTERCLEEHLVVLGGRVDWQTSLVGLTQDDTAVTATLAAADGTEEVVTARWILGADGGRSLTREQLGLTMTREPLGEVFVLADVKTTAALPEQEGHTWYGKHGLLLVVPMPEPGLWRVIAHMPHLAPEERPTIDAAFLDRLIAERTGLDFGSYDITWTSQFAPHQGLADRYRTGRGFLAGDAAHVHSPVGGQGMNTGIQDAHNLVWKLALAQHLTPAEAEVFLDSYQAERRPAAAAMVTGTGRATRVLTSHNAAVKFLLARFGPTVASTGWVQQQLGRGVGMLGLTYEASPILPHGTLVVGLAPGQRVSDDAVDDVRRLHDLLDPAGHTLLELDGDTLTVTTSVGAGRHDADATAVRKLLGLPGRAVAMVRPDHVIMGAWPNRDTMAAFAPAAAVLGRLGQL